MGYLICDKCGGYYELQPGESPDDFTDECGCGGNLEYTTTSDIEDSISDYEDLPHNYNNDDSPLAIYKSIAKENKHNYLEKRDKALDNNISDNLLTNSGFILITFAIFPLKYGVLFRSLPFYLLALCAIILAGYFFYLQKTEQDLTLHKMQRIYSIVSIYFIIFLALFFIWAIMWAASDIVKFLSYYATVMGPVDVLIISYAFLFTQKFIVISTSHQIIDPLTSMGKTTKFIYYIIVFASVATFIFALFAGLYMFYGR